MTGPVLQVVESLERGGLERVVVDLCKGLAARSVDVRVLCLFRGGSMVNMLPVGMPAPLVLQKGRGLDLRTLLKLRRVLFDLRPSVVHTHNAVCAYYTALAGLGIADTRWVNTRHGMGASGGSSRREWLYRLAARRYDVLAAVCRAAGDAFAARLSLPTGRFDVVPNGIRLERFSVPNAGERFARKVELGIPGDAPVIGSVGRLNWAKNFPLLVRAFARVVVSQPHAVLLIVGEGGARAQIQREVEANALVGRVHLLGDREDVPEVLQAVDVFACSSDTEGYSVALVEAAATGLPAVATDVGGNREIVADGVTGYLVPPGEEAPLASRLSELLREDGLRARLASNARAWAVGHAGLDTMVDAYVSLYRGWNNGR
jgi:glycosyltransferase involved in cell wall biosynthesis